MRRAVGSPGTHPARTGSRLPLVRARPTDLHPPAPALVRTVRHVSVMAGVRLPKAAVLGGGLLHEAV